MTDAKPQRMWNRAFVVLWLGLLQSYVGDAFLAVGLMWMVLELTGSPIAASTVLILQGVPKLIGPIAGAVIDRANKKALLIASDVMRGAVLLALFALSQIGALQLWQLYAMVVVLSAAAIFYGPALRVLVPQLVPNDKLPSANSLIQMGQQTSMIAGAILAGLILAVTGASWALLIDGASFLIVAAAIYSVRFPKSPGPTGSIQPSKVLSDMVNGLRFIFKTPEVATLTFLAFFLNLVLSPVNVIFPVFSSTVLGEGVTGFGYLASAIAGGLLIGNFFAGMVIGDRLTFARSIGLGLAGMALSLFAVGSSTTLVPAVLGTVAVGATVPFVQIPLVSRLQRHVPGTFQGRVFATMETLITIATPLGAAVAGQLLARTPASDVFKIGALGTFVVLVGWAGVQFVQRRSDPSTLTLSESGTGVESQRPAG